MTTCRPAPLLAATLLLAPQLQAQAGLSSDLRTVTLAATKPASVTVSLPSGGFARLPRALASGANDFAPIPVVTSWELDPGQTATVSLLAYFDLPARALASAAGAIPASAVHGAVGQEVPRSFTAGAVVLFTEPISTGNARGERSDELRVRIQVTDFGALPAGTYTGTLNLVAVTQ
ncbi:MAG TPA: hypothetical protein VFU46_05890 [Gemmatimonadales bacterium]|nr:hypothetical protein [Gemmatimonadales bacterium]